MLAYQLNNSASTGNLCNKYTIANQQDIRRKLSFLLGKKVPLSIRVPEKSANNEHLTTITGIEDNHIFLEGFSDSEFNKNLLLQDTLDVSADFEGIAVNFRLNELSGLDVDAAFNVKALLPESMEWVQRRDARRVKVPIKLPVKIQHENQSECFEVVDISVEGLSYIDQADGAATGGLYKNSTIILPDNSVCIVNFEIVNNIAISGKHTGPINRVGCQIMGSSYRLDATLQRLINQIDLCSKKEL